MRGTLQVTQVEREAVGIIPAYAGNTWPPAVAWCKAWDHPRVCGEHAVREDEIAFRRGSSPRMRGTPVASVTIRSMAGIIPAYAGNTVPYAFRPPSLGDHPRVCGEHDKKGGFTTWHLGSSPRMRGTQAMMLPAVSAAGIIPAYAGNTLDVHWSSPFVRDHPRVCGEHVRDWRGGVRLGGSSPRMRGTRARRGHSGHGIGIIPAYAGNTNVWPFAAFLHRDHPRVCGEHRMLGHKSAAMTGSSPRMRGTLFVRLGGGAVTGIIPAYAGNTPSGRRN